MERTDCEEMTPGKYRFCQLFCRLTGKAYIRYGHNQWGEHINGKTETVSNTDELAALEQAYQRGYGTQG
jgi:hypothetical protein